MPTNLKDERRADRRYPLAAELDYRIAEGRGQVKTGRGKTINISSSSIFFKPEEPLPPARRSNSRFHGPLGLMALLL